MRYLRLYAHFLRFSFSRAMMFRLDFFFRFFMDLVFYAAQMAFFAALYGHTRTLGGWTWEQARVFVAGYFVVDALHMTVFSSNAWWFPFLVNRGDLDYYLVRPVSSLFFMTLREFAANSFLNLVVAVGILAWALCGHPEPLGAGRILLYGALLLNGALLYGIVHWLFLVPVFWIQANRGLNDVFFGCMGFLGKPHGIFQGWTRRILLTALPYGLMASVPAALLFEGATLGWLAHLASVTGGLFLVLVLLWRRGLRAYASASS